MQLTGIHHLTAISADSPSIDPHVPLERVRESTALLRGMGASVDERIYPGMGHTINADEIGAVDALLDHQPGSQGYEHGIANPG